MKKQIIKIVIFAVALFTVAIAGKIYLDKFLEEKTQNKSKLVASQLLLCQELTTVKNNYSNIASVKKTKLAGLARAFSIVKFEGTIRAGIKDISKTTFEIYDAGKTIEVTLPKCEILDNGITNIEVFDEVQSIFVSVSMEEIINQINQQKTEIEQKQIYEGILIESEEQSKKVIYALLSAIGFEKIIFNEWTN